MKKLLLIGDSMIEFYNWQARFPDYEVFNFGQSGEAISELLWRSKSIIPKFTEPPNLLLIMIGTNNIAMEDFVFSPIYGEIIAMYQEAWPQAVIVVNSILPMQLPYLAGDTVSRINELLQVQAKKFGVKYLDAHSKLVDKKGTALQDILDDEVHLSDLGYQLWSACLEDFLLEVDNADSGKIC